MRFTTAKRDECETNVTFVKKLKKDEECYPNQHHPATLRVNLERIMPFIPEQNNDYLSQELFSIEDALTNENEDLGGIYPLEEIEIGGELFGVLEPVALFDAFDAVAADELEPGEIPEYDITDQLEPEHVNNLPPMNDDELAEIPEPPQLVRQDAEVIYWPHLMPGYNPGNM